MLIEFLMNCGFGVLELLLSTLPDIQWNIDTSTFGKFLDFIDVILYLFPLVAIANIIKIVVSIIIFKIVISTVKTIMSIIPFV